MGTKFYSFLLVVLTFMTTDLLGQAPAITGPVSVCEGTAAVAYTAPAGMAAYNWTVSGGGTITAGALPETITVNWTTAGPWTLSVSDGSVTSSVLTLAVTVNTLPVPTIIGPVDAGGMPATLVKGANLGKVYTTEPLMTGYTWAVPVTGTIVAGAGTESITVDWTNVTTQQSVSVTYTDANGCAAAAPTVLGINYFPFAGPIDPASILQFVDPVPHFAAGLRVNAKTGGNLLVRTQPVTQVALSTGTILANGTIGTTPGAGVGNYAAYQISKDNGVNWGPAMWPAQTIEAQQGFPLTIQYENGLAGLTYDHFNILADQTLMMKGYTLSGDPLTSPYTGEIPMVVHLHGGEIPSNSDGGPNAWMMPGVNGLKGPAFQYNASSLVSYPNFQEAATLWYHPHDDGLTRINVYTGLAGYYFLRGQDEETAQLPGWSGDDLVREATPAGKAPTFNGATAYLPEIELAIQDRMFDVNGQLYWPVAPPNPEIHPFWTPEFVGDIMTVNGKSWPYLSVAPRKYRFRMLDGCNARWLNMWLVNAADGVTPGPKITMIGGEGGLLEVPADLDPALGKTLLIGPGQRADIIIDFTGIPAGTTFTLMNDAGAPYPGGDPVAPGLSDRIMQFVVNGSLVSALDPALPGTDKGLIPAVLRPVNPLVKLTDFAGNMAAGVTPTKTRQLILNEVMSVGGPASVLVNNSYFDTELSFATDPNYRVGGPTEFLEEGTTEIIQIANVSADAHPIHIHLTQWQIVSRQAIDPTYLDAYAAAWAPRGIAPFPVGMAYPGGGGTPYPYETVNADGAIGGNPAFNQFLLGPVIPANPEEMGWKDNVTVLPGEVTTFIVRIAPTDKPVGATPAQLLYPFDPSQGPGYVWHCHIIDHEDMSMMRPLMITASPLRWPQITASPAPVTACIGDAVTFNVTATSLSAMTYQWQVSADGGTTWVNVVDGPPYSGALTASLGISPTALTMTGSLYKCILTNNVGTKETAPVLLTVNTCTLTGTLKYNNLALEPLAGFTVGLNGQTATTGALGEFTFASVSSGAHIVTVTAPATLLPGSVNTTDAGAVNGWALMPAPVPMVKFLAGDVNNSTLLDAADALAIQNNFVGAAPFVRTPWVFHDAAAVAMTTNPPALTANVAGNSATLNILGMVTGDFNNSFSPTFVAPGAPKVILTNNIVPMSVARNTRFDLPIVSTAPLQVGALSLVLNVNTKLVTVQGVNIPGSPVKPAFKVVGNELRIGWNSTVPVNITVGKPLVMLTLMPTPAFIDPNVLTVTLVPSEMNEIADGLFNPVLVAPNLTVDNVDIIGLARVNTLKLTVFPNPATTTTTIFYELPKAGTVTLGLYNANGTPAINPLYVNGIVTPAGVYTVTADVTALLPGTYYVKLMFVETLTLKATTKTVKLIKR